MQEKIVLKKCDKPLYIFCDVCNKEIEKGVEYYHFAWKNLYRQSCKVCKKKIEENAERTRTKQIDYFRKTV